LKEELSILDVKLDLTSEPGEGGEKENGRSEEKERVINSWNDRNSTGSELLRKGPPTSRRLKKKEGTKKKKGNPGQDDDCEDRDCA